MEVEIAGAAREIAEAGEGETVLAVGRAGPEGCGGDDIAFGLSIILPHSDRNQQY